MPAQIDAGRMKEIDASLRNKGRVMKYPSIATRNSLLTRLKDWDDQEGWKRFFETYWRLIYNVAIQHGLSEMEAQEVVQRATSRTRNVAAAGNPWRACGDAGRMA